MDPTLVVVAIIAASASITAAWFAYRGSTRATVVNERANELQWVKELRAEAADARRESSAARAEAAECHRQLTTVRREATALADELHRIVRAIHDPYMSVDRLRAMVPFPPVNGSTPS